MSLLWTQQPNMFGSITQDRLDEFFGRRNDMQSPFTDFDEWFKNDPFFRDAVPNSNRPETHKDEQKEEKEDSNQNFQVFTFESISQTKDGKTTRRTQRRYRDNTGRDFFKEAKELNGTELQYEKKMLGGKVLHETHSLLSDQTENSEAATESIDAFNTEWERELNSTRSNALIDLTHSDASFS